MLRVFTNGTRTCLGNDSRGLASREFLKLGELQGNLKQPEINEQYQSLCTKKCWHNHPNRFTCDAISGTDLDNVSKRLLGIHPVLRCISLKLLDVQADGGTTGASARQTEDDAGAIGEHKPQSLQDTVPTWLQLRHGVGKHTQCNFGLWQYQVEHVS